MTRIASILLLALLACGAPSSTEEISAQELLASAGSDSAPLILDVRTPEEFALGHVPGALNISLDQIASRLNELRGDKDRPVVTYCERGARAGVAATELRAAGFSVLNLTGQLSGWREAGLPIEK